MCFTLPSFVPIAKRGQLQRYSVAVLSPIAALLLTRLLWWHLQPAIYPFFLAAVIVSSWYGGLRAGLISTVLSTFISEFLFSFTAYSLGANFSNAGRVIYFVLVALLVCLLDARARSLQRRTELHALEAERLEKERSQLLEREQAARAEAEEANRAKDEFLAAISHELRTPLTAILGWVGMLQTEMLDQAEVTNALEIIERNANLQAQLIEDLIDISRIIHAELRINHAAVNLVDMITAAVEVVQPKIDAKQLQFEFLLDSSIKQNGDSLLVWGDTDRLQQVLWNLLSNAVKFTPEAGRVTVKLERIEQAKPIAQITVTDTGVGIRADFLPYVFDRFRQADSTSARSYSGLGLGLAIAQYLVEQHNGTIQAESFGEGQGATFIVRLPLL